MEQTLKKIIKELELKENESLVLFLNDKNGWRTDNPIADLVVIENYDYDLIKEKERKIPGVYHKGGDWKQAVTDAGLNFKEIISGKKCDFTNSEIVNHIKNIYNVISGTY